MKKHVDQNDEGTPKQIKKHHFPCKLDNDAPTKVSFNVHEVKLRFKTVPICGEMGVVAVKKIKSLAAV